MAGSVTHYFFANDVMNLVNKKEKIDYNQDYLNTFAQSMDTFNFYSLFFPIKKESGKVRKLAGTFHHTKTDEFFNVLINYIKDNKLSDDVIVMTFLYGLITHYVLDSTIHPFVEYKCGRFSPKDKSTYKYNAKHHEMETFIDIYMLERHKIESKKYKTHNEIFKIKDFPESLKKVMNYTYSKVFAFQDFDKYYLHSIKDMKNTFKVFRYDPHKYKKNLYKIFDKITPKVVLNAKFLSYSYIPKDAHLYLNNEHKTWFYPYDTSKKLNYSYDDLYEIALSKCEKIIIDVNKYIKGKKKIEISSLFNLSYATGLDLKIPEINPKYEF